MRKIEVPNTKISTYPVCRSLDSLPEKSEAMANAMNNWIQDQGIERIVFVITGTSGAYLISELYQRVEGVDKYVLQVAKKNRREGGHHRDTVEGRRPWDNKLKTSVVFVDDQVSSGRTLSRTQEKLMKSEGFRADAAVIYLPISEDVLSNRYIETVFCPPPREFNW